MKRFALILPLLLFGCDLPPDTIASKIQDGVAKGCAFKADYSWLTEVVVKADITAQAIDNAIDALCGQIIAATSVQSLLPNECKYGQIYVDGEHMCIEGEPIQKGGQGEVIIKEGK